MMERLQIQKSEVAEALAKAAVFARADGYLELARALDILARYLFQQSDDGK